MKKNEKNMKIKQIIIATILSVFISTLLIFLTFPNKGKKIPVELYQVYLDGEKIGLVENKDALLTMIDAEQNDIKKQYNVNAVYPPNGFEIKDYVTYEQKADQIKNVYNQIKVKGDFTIKGFLITINKPMTDLDGHVEKIYLQVLDETIFKEALEKVVTAFVSEIDYDNYVNNKQEEIKDTGQFINDMTFTENITIKEANISVEQKIYTNVNELTQYLLFGSDQKNDTYTVKQGDTITNVAFDNKLSVNEFLIANTKFKSEDSLLLVGEEVNVTLINPLVNMFEQRTVVEDVEVSFDKLEQVDSSKPANYKEIIQQGVTGITRVTREEQYENGQISQGVALINQIPLIEKVDQITVVGQKKVVHQSASTQCSNLTKDWSWPTLQIGRISSPYGPRKGDFHEAIDITGTGGKGSPIYASKDGVVVSAGPGCHHWSYGTCVIVQHPDGFHSLYAHLTSYQVQVGQSVSKGQLIAGMGMTGTASGIHLHFAVFTGYPHYGNSAHCNPTYIFENHNY